MTKVYAEVKEEGKVSPETWLVKTYMVEAHPGGNNGHDDVAQKIGESVRLGIEPRRGTASLSETEDEGFFQLQVGANGRQATLYIDASEPRYWLVHSMDSGEVVQWAIDRLTLATPDLDKAWLPVSLLEDAARRGAFRGLGLDFDRRAFLDGEGTVEEPVTYLKMQLWGNRAPDVLRVLQQQEAFPHESTLSKIRARFTLGDEQTRFSIDTLKFDGKVTASGTSFQSHLTFVTTTYRRYAKAMEGIERTARITPESSNGKLRLRGAPVHFDFRSPIADVVEFSRRLFTSTPPFRLWGVPTQVGRDYIRVSAVDLHVGQPLDFEIGPGWMRVYLHAHTCGNTIVRLLTNLQHRVDSQVKAEINGQCIPEL